MPMDLLRRIERTALPLVIHSERDVHSAIVLAAAEMIKAHLPAVGDTSARPAVVFRITDTGRLALSKAGSVDGAAHG